MPANLEKSAVATGLEKVSFHCNPQKRAIPKMFKLSHKIALIAHSSKEMLKILQAKLQQYVNGELQMFKLDLEKAEDPVIKLPTFV